MYKRVASASVLGSVFLACTGGPSDVTTLGAAGFSSGASNGTPQPAAPPVPMPALPRGSIAARRPANGAPSFIWANRNPAPLPALPQGISPEAAARAHLERFSSYYGLDATQVAALELRSVHDTGRGALIARFGRRVAGLQVFGEQVAVAMDRTLGPVALTGSVGVSLPSAAKLPAAAGAAPSFPLDAAHAVLASVADLTRITLTPSDLDAPVAAQGEYQSIGLGRAQVKLGTSVAEPSRVKRVFYPREGKPNADLVPAYYVETHLGHDAQRQPRYFAHVVSAVDGAILWKRNLTMYEAYGYRVYADSNGLYTPWDGPEGTQVTPHPSAEPDAYEPPLLSANLVTLSSLESVGVNDPWLPPGATTTLGNNVDAYLDSTDPDGFTPGKDVRGVLSAPGVFDYTADLSSDANANSVQRQAALTQLFYDLNWFHDWYYAAGFTEAVGNAQFSNYGRGGLEGDAIRAEAQDSSGVDNANMSTPADGGRPVMQMYLWVFGQPTLTLSSPASVAGSYETAGASYGPLHYDLAGEIVRADPADACTALPGDYTGRIVLLDQGNCLPSDQALHAEAAGASAVLIANVASTPDPTEVMGPEDAPGDPLSIPIATLNLADGDRLRASLSAGETLSATLSRDAQLRDGDLDNQVIAHEWGHYISNRLILDGGGLNSQLGSGLGEGWADFHALLMTVRAEDIENPTNAEWNGVYGMGGYAAGNLSRSPYYFGIRRYPYSTDFTKDPLTFKHISNAAPLPPDVPRSYDVDHTEPHAVGEVWATMLWECYAALLRDTLGATPRLSFNEARDHMRDYLVASYQLTPGFPTLLEARDALLAAALASDNADYSRFVEAFARRGAGVNAVDPDRVDLTNGGVVESYAVGAAVAATSLTLADDVKNECNPDGLLDNGETGTLRIAFQNTGSAPSVPLTVLVTSTTAGVTFPEGAAISIPALAVQGSAVGTLHVAAAGLDGVTPLDFSVQVPDAGAGQPPPRTERFWANADEVPEASLSDGAERSRVLWRVEASDQNTPLADRWQRVEESPTEHVYHCTSALVPDAVDFISPPLHPKLGVPFTLSFRHRYNFEGYSDGTAYDGGVIELSADGGSTWVDVGTELANYPGAITTDSDNPLGGRPAFVVQNPGYPNYVAALLDFGETYAGQEVLLRFRVASDSGNAFSGWDIDDLTFSGLVDAPFDSLEPQPASCNNAPIATVGLDQFVLEYGPAPAFERPTVTLDGSASFDADGDALSYEWTQIGGPPVTLDAADGPLPTFLAPEVSTSAGFEDLSFQLVVSDGRRVSTAQITHVFVVDVARSPIADAGAAQTVKEGSLVRLDGSASSDPDGDPLSYSWVAPEGVFLSNPNSAQPAFLAPDVRGDSVLSFTLTVSDGQTASDAATVQITVHDLDAPPAPAANGSPDAGPVPAPSTSSDAGPAPTASPASDARVL